jgi:hypothetical protein
VSEVCLEVFEEFSDFCGGVLQVGERVEDWLFEGEVDVTFFDGEAGAAAAVGFGMDVEAGEDMS